MHHEPSDFLLGLAGILAPVMAVLTSLQEQVEWWLRIAGLLAGLVVAVLSAAALLRKMQARDED